MLGGVVVGLLVEGVDVGEVVGSEVVESVGGAVVGGLAVELVGFLVVDVSGGSDPCGRLVLVALLDMVKALNFNRGISLYRRAMVSGRLKAADLELPKTTGPRRRARLPWDAWPGRERRVKWG